ncbi:NAD-dependent protein deacetylase [Halomonas sp. MCCC 1A17488]|uniref:NAD-dependent protein deacetylase n=1 Tax=unclassified Halomonas TaxID=2609666 RepID=UPI0018D22E46|nr:MULTISPECIES: NAD-dependent protein deacetylase [unclassified Halomonas]MCE8016888.1 NAD-dependent protein deacetylase [Halomonas sp. MCCC 1A17488]MCG3240221.1 NAD-dependent protein deacetylase [Halomonas sp. MCCC 1A17488]QPP49902.1 NAD-dependent protein deacetylase [Halomonas sp. SS10-MC5]
MNDTRQPAVTEAIERLRAFMARHPRLAVLTGAGVSTESGIPDYRDASGAWKCAPPMQHRQFMASHAARQRYWARALIGFRALHRARPGDAHRALARLEQAGRVHGVITQNVDGLHQKAGSRRVVDLHGRAELVRCMGCGALRMRHDLHAELAERNPHWLEVRAEIRPDGDADVETDFTDFEVPGCRRCGQGIWKPDVVFFGDSVPLERVARARTMVDEADALLVVGSSLMVYSGYRFARQAAAAGRPIACLNLGRTRADALYALKLEAPVGEVLAAVAATFTGAGRAAG